MTALAQTPVFDAADTAALLDYRALLVTLGQTVADYAAGEIVSPERLVVPLQAGGVMLSMPSSARDLAIHKLVNVCPGNGARGLPTILGQVIACDATTGEMRFVLDGPTVTGRRTAAVTALGIQALHGAAPRDILLIGTGKQAANHAEALATIFPDARLHVRGARAESAAAFCDAHRAHAPRLVPLDGDAIPDAIDVVVTLTTSRTPVYRDAAREGRLVVGVGAFTADAAEIDANTVRQSRLVVDDPAGARHEAGDLILAQVDWQQVASLADVLNGRFVRGGPLLFKSVGCAAWDLAACRTARDALAARRAG
ncbi:delta(1)-pyrroline-2-carboxylate reductase family protein [Burkholderia pseudomultivorans]|uniref:bifunctional Delta(1)-pyrroline-2-carboxylate/Delta(1)-piperideine-2- carboxylate reductase n=1 Tax=Burkholderia pseudomultivorans TaxID=1207504 RepID=UPI00075B2F92|nr:bifunctional Delta(1)-pyrroline-2-carboxylate/Delta(1)-piperideine-2-carboxylate reductase [Burkholderia pseudomultivorans]AOI88510.1 ornithine cyclodeaminase [Burkholderia pseudomultivorans]KVC26626.1 ornithine cyclodeaminase [Burkholderia pseudomultivorans]KVC29894.1 ornithine cyclodeaminase [Burkholderia pseudomultivorans]KVC46496.1 ornithine cyclodeaminase [Burkholderia pseudomultivorans]MDS0796282.1 delta(1)-pyrroline-2-carboxylate reductase family protein [Burkholderia pseudomultivora